METMADGGTKHEGFPKEKRGDGVREVGLGGKGRRGEERGGGSEESGRTRAGWRLWNRGSMCRPRVQRVASACALTSSRSLSLSHLLSVSFLLFAFTRGLLIRRERGDNSSPSLSLDDARFPPRVVPHRLTPSTVLMPSPERGHAVVPFPTASDVANGTRSDVGPRRGLFPSRSATRIPSPPFVGGALAESLFFSRCRFVRNVRNV